ncbi:iron siderophore-binding protein [Rhodococcus sp. Eu-32]|uniref:ABC transporter substrate-binding protein n=1 Tax=Rhodococcus sp. Eu-32 TaxID=1017319 RepID=UPI000DF1795F|nr:ABC transporter substrate-binding protein [Rhodococcus sp. Eu-32]RRQ26707.1 iron siderophore-binding protein [Rhodococcus sp. Eu-32]
MSDTQFRRRGLRAVAALAAVTIGLTACSSSDAESDGSATTNESSSDTRVVSTDKGDVTVPADPQRIAVLSAGLAGYLFTLDAPIAITDTRLLGVTNLDGGFPPQWAEKAQAQGTQELPAGEALNIEAIAQAEPDLIIGGGQGISAVQADEAYDQLTAIAPTVLIPSSVNTWQGQLEAVADAAGESDKVDGLLDAYEDKVAEVEDAITVPGSPVAYFLSLSTNEPAFIPQTATLPELLKTVGFEPDDVLTKADNPELYGSGDSFIISNELLGNVATAPVVIVVPVAGRGLNELKQDPAYANLPAFASGNVFELPATSYRPDYDGVISTLDQVQTMFAK